MASASIQTNLRSTLDHIHVVELPRGTRTVHLCASHQTDD